jgi:hypothetical protein
MTGPGDDRAAAAAGHGHLRAGHADRDRTVGELKAAFVQGRLARDEFEQRLGQALTSRTYADLSAVTADLPPGLKLPTPQLPTPPEPARDADHRTAVKVIAALTALSTIRWLMVAVRDTGASGFFGSSLFFVLIVLIVVPGMSAGLLLLHARLERRASQQSLPGRPPGGAGRPGQRTGPAQPRRKHPPAGPPYTAYQSALAG